MLLRSSSTPLAQPLLSDCLTGDYYATADRRRNRLNFVPLFCKSAQIPNSSSGSPELLPKPLNLDRNRKPFRRSRSDGNLEGLDSSNSLNFNGISVGKLEEKKTMLHTEPSFSIYAFEEGLEENGSLGHVGDSLERSGSIGESVKSEGGEFSFGDGKGMGMGMIEENDEEEMEGLKNLSIDVDEEEDMKLPVSPRMYLATGFGLDANSVGGNDGDLKARDLDENGDVEEYYKMRINSDPHNPLFLRNYAQLLQSKGDLLGAEEYYFRATLADPNDGEILMQYARLLWELHHDQERALSYFESAARAAPQDSNVLAAYASFLWEIDEGEDSDGDYAHDSHNQIPTLEVEKTPVSSPRHLEEQYKRMVVENPSNPLFLRNYAQFLRETKGDLEGAEEYYSRAMLADPGDGEVISQYAQLVWELHHDQAQASPYFESSVQAAPTDSHILAAYAKFLWETEDEVEDNTQLPVLEGTTVFAKV